jgi:outer membrane protein
LAELGEHTEGDHASGLAKRKTEKMLKAVMMGATAAVLSGGTALAQSSPDGFTIGALGIVSTNPYEGADVSTAAVPLLAWKQGNLSISTGEGLRLKLLDSSTLSFSAVVSPRFPPFDDKESSLLSGMDRGFTADMGGLVEFAPSDTTRFSLRAVTELTGEHGGQEVILGAQSRIAIGSFPVLLGGGAKWQSSDLAQYTFGVSPSEATGGRPAYAPGDSVIPFLSLGTIIPLNERSRVFGSLKAEFLPDSVTDSPTVDDNVVTSLAVGVSFGF